MDKSKIDISKYRELSPTYLKSLSGARMMSYDIIDQERNVLFNASEEISLKAIEDELARGKKFYIPRPAESQPAGSYHHEIISQKTMTRLAKETYKIYSEVRKSGAMHYREYSNSRKYFTEITSRLKNEDKHGGILPLLKKIKKFDYYLYTHSVNVGVLVMVLFHKLGYPREKVENLAVAGHLHDIGKLKVPMEIINKTGKLTAGEYSSIMKHTRDGYSILDGVVDPMENRIVPNTTKLIALFHHRKFKYRGYPARKERDSESEQFYNRLPEEVRLTGICDMYDAATTATPFRKGLAPEEGLRYILNTSNHNYSTGDVHRFLKPMIQALNGGKGILAGGDFVVVESEITNSGIETDKEKKYEFAIVVDINKNYPMDPSIRIFYDATKNRRIRQIEVNLRKDFNRKIVRVLNNQKLKEMFSKLYK